VELFIAFFVFVVINKADIKEFGVKLGVWGENLMIFGGTRGYFEVMF
jgi:hypothetical protein